MRSDTVTKPTDEMRQAAGNAEVGDDVFGDDPSVNKLERYAAELVGMEDALFVTSGTQGNLLALMTHTLPGDEVLLEYDSHIFNYEVGGISSIAGAMPRTFKSEYGYLPETDLAQFIKSENIHYAMPKLLCLENTHNRHGGIALSVDEIREMASFAMDNNLMVHLDGARIFNASVYHDVDVKKYTSEVDSIQFCLSKGLSAPVGSILAGTEEFIEQARKNRKVLGGGMRQVGVIAAPGLIALKNMRDRLKEDHDNARLLTEGLTEMGFTIKNQQTNIVVCNISAYIENASEAVEKLHKVGIWTVPFGPTTVRLTTHRHISKDDIEYTLNKIQSVWL